MTIRKFVFLAILLLVLGTARAEEAETDVDNLVFVGRLVAIEELPNPCASGDCIFMDGLWQARYEIERTLVGAYPQREITVRIADG